MGQNRGVSFDCPQDKVGVFVLVQLVLCRQTCVFMRRGNVCTRCDFPSKCCFCTFSFFPSTIVHARFAPTQNCTLVAVNMAAPILGSKLSLYLQDCLILHGTNASTGRFLWHVVVHQRYGGRVCLAPGSAFCSTLVDECIKYLREVVTAAEHGVSFSASTPVQNTRECY